MSKWFCEILERGEVSVRIRSILSRPLSVPLREPFVIASARIDVTRAALVKLELLDEQRGAVAFGYGEAAALPPVTPEDQPDLLRSLARAADALIDRTFERHDAIAPALDDLFDGAPVARAALESAWLDAWARHSGLPLCTLLSGRPPRSLLTDITLPIAPAEEMVQRAAAYRARDFRLFKIKVGRRLEDDVQALQRVHARVPDARFRLDANGGFSANDALALLSRAASDGLAIECFEQPCPREDLAGMARVKREGGVPVIADESVRDIEDLSRVLAAHAADGINLKLAKSGGLLAALALGERARAEGLQVMCGGMVETRLGMSAMAHVACALVDVEYIDLDTAFLLAEEHFSGGYRERGPILELTGCPGLDVEPRL
ncbi:MAG TPA: dipeptide epimerase [Polyangiales bacterium]|jgi:L-alanine-DL-glutamate epimerase-like enolase superfamily enzyme